MVVFDNNYLVHLFHPEPEDVMDPASGKPVELVKEKINNLVQTLDKSHERILIPTPVLAEFFSILPDRAAEYFIEMEKTYRFVIAPFDAMAAIETGITNARAIAEGNKRSGLDATWAKVKFDRQIVAIAKTQRANTIYSNDSDIRKLAYREAIPVVPIWELPQPPARQSELDFLISSELAESQQPESLENDLDSQ